MPRIISLSFKNVCSYGNKMQSIPFGSEPTLTLITGENGAGKTTIGNALEFSWYGQTRRRKIKELANRLNGHLETYNKFVTDDGRTVEIARGIDPQYFELKVDGVPDTKAGKPKLDAYIESELLNMPFEVCTNTMILSINDFKSFVKIKAEDKRKIVDRIFGLDILNKMMALLKADLKTASEDLAKVEAVMSHQNATMAQSEAQLAELEANLLSETETLEAELNEQIRLIDAEVASIGAAIATAKAEAESLAAELLKKTEGIDAEYLIADNEETEKMTLAENACNDAIARDRAAMDDEERGVLGALDEKYGKTIADITAEADATEIKLKRILADKTKAANDALAAHNGERFDEYKNAENEIAKTAAGKRAKAEDAYKNAVKAAEVMLEGVLAEINRLQSDMQSNADSKAALVSRNAVLTEKISLYENNVCPECETDLTDHFHASRKAEFEREMAGNVTAIAGLVGAWNELGSQMGERTGARDVILAEKDAARTEFDSAVAEIGSSEREASGKLAAAYNDGRLKAMEAHNAAISNMQSEYNAAHAAGVANKRGDAKNAEHELEMAKEKTKSEYSGKRIKSRDGHWKAMSERKETAKKEREARVKEIDARRTSIGKEYDALISEKNQASAVLDNDRQNKEAQSNLRKRDLDDSKAKAADNASVKSIRQMLGGMKAQMESLLADQAEAGGRIKKCLIAQELLAEDGIKKRFMSTVLPTMNATIRRMIDEFQYKFNFRFDENFDAVIEDMGHEISPESLSTGEEKMIDIIVVLSVMELIMMKHPQINVMFLDEIFASLDQNNIERTIKILRDFMRKYSITLFAISHTMMPKQFFDRVISVTSDGMFSDIAVS